MTKKTNEGPSLVDEIVANARADRNRLVEFAENIRKLNGAKNELGGFSDDTVDPEVSVAMSEEICRITDSLTKINQQLVEIVKAEKKKEPSVADVMSEKEKSKIYDEVEKHKQVKDSQVP